MDWLARLGNLLRRQDYIPPEQTDGPDPEAEARKQAELREIQRQIIERENALRQIEMQSRFWRTRRAARGNGEPHIW